MNPSRTTQVAAARLGAGCNKPAGSVRSKPSRWCKTTRTEQDFELVARGRWQHLRVSPGVDARRITRRRGANQRIPREEAGRVPARASRFRARTATSSDARRARATVQSTERPASPHRSEGGRRPRGSDDRASGRRDQERKSLERPSGNGQGDGGCGKDPRAATSPTPPERDLWQRRPPRPTPKVPPTPCDRPRRQRQGTRITLDTLKGR